MAASNTWAVKSFGWAPAKSAAAMLPTSPKLVISNQAAP